MSACLTTKLVPTGIISAHVAGCETERGSRLGRCQAAAPMMSCAVIGVARIGLCLSLQRQTRRLTAVVLRDDGDCAQSPSPIACLASDIFLLDENDLRQTVNLRQGYRLKVWQGVTPGRLEWPSGTIHVLSFCDPAMISKSRKHTTLALSKIGAGLLSVTLRRSRIISRVRRYAVIISATRSNRLGGI